MGRQEPADHRATRLTPSKDWPTSGAYRPLCAASRRVRRTGEHTEDGVVNVLPADPAAGDEVAHRAQQLPLLGDGEPGPRFLRPGTVARRFSNCARTRSPDRNRRSNRRRDRSVPACHCSTALGRWHRSARRSRSNRSKSSGVAMARVCRTVGWHAPRNGRNAERRRSRPDAFRWRADL